MTKKAFTLVELLAVMVILGILSSIVIPSVFTMIKKAQDDSYNILVESFEENARLYLTRHKEDTENSLESNNYYILTLNDLINDGLLKTPLNDPRSGLDIDLSKQIIITRESEKSFDICYEDRGCYIPTLLVDELTKVENIVSGTTEGLHYDAVNDFYYFRGSNPNNWIEFNGYLWRIVKVNTDESIKLIFEGTATETGTTENGTINNRTFDDSNVNNYDTEISIKTYLQTWYDANITSTNKTKIQSLKWCIGKIEYEPTGTSKETFLSNECLTQTTDNESIGLITGSEYLYASLDTTCLTAYKTTGDNGFTCKNNNYLYKNSYNYWSLTGDNNTTDVWGVNTSGGLGAPVAANTTSEVRPVINLISSVVVDMGNGTFNNPYILKDITTVDRQKPTITILGENPVAIGIDSEYIDAGATASDNIEGDITSKIITVSNVNTSVEGNYTVIYRVSDNLGNTATAVRTVNVVKSYAGPGYIEEKGVNGPVLATGMIPIKWNGSTWVDTAINDIDWYNYTTGDKKWANARTADGSMWVWIPRYVYRISNGWHTATAGTIDIQFSMNIDDTRGETVTLDSGTGADASNNKWTNHPAFTFGSTQVTGVWVAKFEPSGTAGAIDIKPSEIALSSLTISDMFTASRNMETNDRYGWGTSGSGIDTHMAKNIEWGAIVYLSKSSYGKTTEVWINPSSDYITGCAGTGSSVGATSGCSYYYETENGQQASTTGNIYGIYDMSGGSYEYTAAYIDNSDSNLANGSVLIAANIKYRDVYDVTSDSQLNNYNNALNKKGDSIYETSAYCTGSESWNGDYSAMPYVNYPWFNRGALYLHTTYAGIFAFMQNIGTSSASDSFRPILLVESGL